MKQFINIYECDKPVSKSKTFSVTGTIIMKNLYLLFILLSFQITFAQVAPVLTPTGGFAIDGGLKANTPTANIGDWFPGPGVQADQFLMPRQIPSTLQLQEEKQILTVQQLMIFLPLAVSLMTT